MVIISKPKNGMKENPTLRERRDWDLNPDTLRNWFSRPAQYQIMRSRHKFQTRELTCSTLAIRKTLST